MPGLVPAQEKLATLMVVNETTEIAELKPGAPVSDAAEPPEGSR